MAAVIRMEPCLHRMSKSHTQRLRSMTFDNAAEGAEDSQYGRHAA